MKVKCSVCMHHCNIQEGNMGLCGARSNVNGEIVCTNYGKITSFALDPIEKKPLMHFLPGTKILSVGSYGCNLNCSFCQNHSISMVRDSQVDYDIIMPDKLVQYALDYKKRGNIGIAYTYNEPLIGYEYVRDCAKLAKENGLRNVVITNGCVELEPMKELFPYIDAFNIDLKGFTHSFYKNVRGNIDLVKAFIQRAAEESHIEITTLVIPNENDTKEEIIEAAKWIASIKDTIPYHISRFFPQWKMQDRDATDVAHIYELVEEARKYLKFVYKGNC